MDLVYRASPASTQRHLSTFVASLGAANTLRAAPAMRIRGSDPAARGHLTVEFENAFAARKSVAVLVALSTWMIRQTSRVTCAIEFPVQPRFTERCATPT